MTFLSINTHRVNTARIDQALFPDAQTAVVWHNGNREPAHCLPDEVDAVRRYVESVMFTPETQQCDSLQPRCDCEACAWPCLKYGRRGIHA